MGSNNRNHKEPLYTPQRRRAGTEQHLRSAPLPGNGHERQRGRDRRARLAAAPANGTRPLASSRRAEEVWLPPALPGPGRGCFHDVTGGARGQVGSGAGGDAGTGPCGAKPAVSSGD